MFQKFKFLCALTSDVLSDWTFAGSFARDARDYRICEGLISQLSVDESVLGTKGRMPSTAKGHDEGQRGHES